MVIKVLNTFFPPEIVFTMIIKYSPRALYKTFLWSEGRLPPEIFFENSYNPFYSLEHRSKCRYIASSYPTNEGCQRSGHSSISYQNLCGADAKLPAAQSAVLVSPQPMPADTFHPTPGVSHRGLTGQNTTVCMTWEELRQSLL